MAFILSRPVTILPKDIRANAKIAIDAFQFAHLRPFSTSNICLGKDKVLLLDEILLAKHDRKKLEKEAEVIVSQAKDRDGFLKEIQSIQPKALYRHFGAARSIKITGKFDQSLVSQLPPSLQFLCHNGAGYDQLDIQSLTSKNIQVSNVPKVVDDATATTALWLLIGALRQFPTAIQQMNHGKFNSQFPFKEARDPGPRQAKVLGIVGAGGIGKSLAKKACLALDMQIIYHNRNRLSFEQEDEMTEGSSVGPAQYVSSLEELLQRSDAVSLHCPLNEKTKHLIGAKQLELMQPHSVLINTARGPIIDEEALANALQNDQIAGVGLDVFENEPTIHPILLKHPRALLLPRKYAADGFCNCTFELLLTFFFLSFLPCRPSY